MTLADAIRLGGTLSKKQITELLFSGDSGTCALGGAGLAVGLRKSHVLDRDHTFLDRLREFCPELAHEIRNSRCPSCGDYFGADIQDAVVHLNDDHRWTRDQIADFVESLVPPAPPEPAIETAVCPAVEVPA